MTGGAKRWIVGAATVLGAAVSVLLPVLLWKLNLPIVGSTSGPDFRVFELFAFVVTLVVVVTAAVAIKARLASGRSAILPLALFALLALYFLSRVVEYARPSNDWECYAQAARAVLVGGDPYAGDLYLHYPPLIAVVLAATYRAVSAGARLAGIEVDPAFAWQGVFYVYQCCQYFLILAGLCLCFLLARRLGASSRRAAILVAVVFVLNVPLSRTLSFHQVNLWVLDLALIAFVTPSAVLVGTALGLAAHVKLYAAILLVPFVIVRRVAVVGWAFLVGAGIVLLQTKGGADPTLWREFLASLARFQPGTVIRDNGLHGIVFNTLSLGSRLVGSEGAVSEVAVWVVTALASLVVTILVARRLVRRERSFASLGEGERARAATERLQGHLLDLLALSLIVSPIVWEHHYVLAIPVILAAAVKHGSRRPWAVGIASAAILAVPVFDVFPFSYSRIAGLIVLLAISTPEISKRDADVESPGNRPSGDRSSPAQ